MPRDLSIKKVLVIGSGPIVIGQAAEFDYAGTQACRSLKEEGIEVVLLNSNPATIMTDKDIADSVYIEPLTVEVVEQLIKKEKPDSVLPTLGGQAGLNLAMELEEAGFLRENGVRLIGTTSETIKKAEDRLEFKATMEKIGEPVAASLVVESVDDGLAFANKIGYPVVLRPAYTLGGSGGGIAHDSHQLVEILENGLRLSRVGQVLVERCIAGWKEIEYEVMRDSAGNCITVCNMENIDPVGVHTGDSIVVAPSQTLGDKEYQMLRTSALNIISELNITGGCNVQYALNPDTFEYCVIEVNPRVSRSSALASKATGYPIAKVSAKIALGYTLDEIKNAITQKTYASFEPMLDYGVVKLPRLPFDKFISAKRTLTTQMKATGEVMSICDNFEGALMKAIRSLEQHVDSLMSYDFTGLSRDDLLEQLAIVDDMRMWKIAEAIRRGIDYDTIYNITKVDKWFIDKFAIIVEMENALKTQELTVDLLREAKRIEFPDNVIARLTGKSEREIHDMRHENGIVAAIYFLLCLLLPFLSYGTLQIRIAELLNLLCFFRPDFIVGVTLGCFLANLMSTLGWPDILVGTGATLLSCILIAYASRYLFIAALYPIAVNAFVVGAELCWLLEIPWSEYWYQAGMVAAGEAIAMAVGYLIFFLARKNKTFFGVIAPSRHYHFKC